MTVDDKNAEFRRLVGIAFRVSDEPNAARVLAATVDLWCEEPSSCVGALETLISYFRTRGILPSSEICAQALPTGNAKAN